MIYVSPNLIDSSCERNFIDLVKESLKRQFESKRENIDIDKIFTNNIDDSQYAIVHIESLMERNPAKIKDEEKLKGKKIILIVDKRIDGKIFDKFLDFDILGIFRKERLCFEYEELGKFEKIIKEIIRDVTYKKIEKLENSDTLYKKIPYKEIRNWKLADIEFEDRYEFFKRNKYISIFLDPSMQKFVSSLRKIIEDFRKAYKTYKKIFDEIRKIADTYEIKEIDKKLNDEKLKKFFEQSENIFLPSLLIEGDTGTGKSLIAEIIGSRVTEDSVYKFSLVNIEKNLVDSELFGTREGAYTGAINKKGIIFSNVGKCVFLDEIAEIPPNVQTKLLLYLDNFKIRPDGYDGNPFLAPTFIIAATNKDLKREIKIGNFREDLYYRFKYKIRVPSLKERKEDLRFLINFILLNPYINHYDKETRKYQIEKIALEAIEKLESYDYPGNFRELESILRNAINLAQSEGLDIILDRHIEI
ncbi:sigma 54-interacting transcriptional regulator [Fervidobacterium sp. 2310opik-2]|uniref:sigma-54-dependent transcriptional regulator n=1 Tax=Fervidobacterium sp. 2310opik-2 TaxID=1755815 RepID=UPI0013E0DB58|nr:sigma 54-interacting transcriptional regulator [Fervidobacterium sp. 2310opik-2]KAF2961315.1 hypothetical protein AS161_01860 [Fervidobacterium sp. 2310opik-2]